MNIELRLLSTMLKSGDFGPIIRGDIQVDHFGTSQGEAVFDFIQGYKRATDGAAPWPSLSIVRERFKAAHIELPDPDEADTVDNLAFEVRVLKLRSEIREAAVAMETVAEGAVDPLEAIAPLLAKLRKNTESHARVQHASLASSAHEVVAQYKTKEIMPEGLPFPWPSLTKATKGLQRHEFVVIAGRPKSRKTFTALRILAHAVKHHHARVLVFSPEMPVRQILLRSIAHMADLPYAEFKDGSMREGEETRLFEVAQRYGRVKDQDDAAYQLQLSGFIPGLGDRHPSLDIIQSTGRDTNWLAQQIEIYRPDIVLVDSFYKQRAPGGKKNDSDWKAVAATSRELKDMAMETGVCVLGTHQLNRDAQKNLGDITNVALADAIGQDVDSMYRVVTGTINGQDVSALYNFASRDVQTEGVMIMNRPCYDYSEIGPIVNRQQVVDLMKQEEVAAAKEENERIAKTKSAPQEPAETSVHAGFKRGGKESKFKRPKRAMEHTESSFSRQLDADYKAALGDE